MQKRARRGRPRTSPLSRQEQLRVAKRAHRQRQRKAGMTEVSLRLPREEAGRLRVAAKATHFREALESFLDETVIDVARWPALRELAWNRAEPWIAAEDALALYERNWRFVDQDRLDPGEASLVERLKQRFGRGILNA